MIFNNNSIIQICRMNEVEFLLWIKWNKQKVAEEKKAILSWEILSHSQNILCKQSSLAFSIWLVT